ncbi:MAG: GNAT family N-acetyltransferase [Elainellaceae cyanobacterium]
MTSQFEYQPLNDSGEAQKLGELLTQCFISPPGVESRYIDRIGMQNFRAIYRARELLGGLSMIPMGQWYGGQRVPMVGIASVGIAPEYRSSGAAIALMQQMIKELYQQGMALSALYPAAQRLYRKAGYEQGGTYCGWKIIPDHIQLRDIVLPVQAISPSLDWVQPIYQRQAHHHNGNLDRHPCLWQELLQVEEQQPLYVYRLGSPSDPEGYLIFDQKRTSEGTTLNIRDWATLTNAAGRSIWAFLASHRSQIDTIYWKGGSTDFLTLMLPEQRWESRFNERWMLRIIDIASALESRGYPSYLEVELHLNVHDDLIPENNGPLTLSVADGKGSVMPGGKAELAIDIRGLASLYSGLFSPHQLQLAGYLTGTDTSMAIATQLFSSTEPWMPDFF